MKFEQRIFRKPIEFFLLIATAFCLTLIYQVHQIGDSVYQAKSSERLYYHNALVNNRASKASEHLFYHDTLVNNHMPNNNRLIPGCEGCPTRPLAVQSAEWIRTTTGLSVHLVHIVQDTVFLFLTFLLLYIYLRWWVSPLSALLGLFYLGSMGALLGQYWTFHPWDQMSRFVWLLGLLAVTSRKHLFVLLATAVGMLIKEDIILLPILHGMMVFHDAPERKALFGQLIICAGLFLFAVGERELIRHLVAADPLLSLSLEDTLHMNLQRNWYGIKRDFFIAWPPILFYSLPLGITLFQWRKLTRVLKINLIWVLSCICLAFFLGAGLEEVRNQIPFLFVLLPGALVALSTLLKETSEQHNTNSSS